MEIDEIIARLEDMGTITPPFDINESHSMYVFDAHQGYFGIQRFVRVGETDIIALEALLDQIKDQLWIEITWE